MSDFSALVNLYSRVLALCAVKNGEVVAVLTEGEIRSVEARAYLAAAEEYGAQAFQLNLRPRSPSLQLKGKQTSLSGNEAAITVLKQADMLVDLIGLLWSAEQKQIQEAGTRILLSREPIEVIRRMFPTVELRQRVEAGQKLLASARQLRIRSVAGTDVTYRLGQYPVVTQYGYTDEAGQWDNLPGGFLYTGGSDGGVDGVVVLDVGDLIFPFKRYVSSPLRFQIKDGMVTSVDGRGIDAQLLRTYMSKWNDPNAYAVSHIGWGMDEKAEWDFLGTTPSLGALTNGVDGRSFYGNVLFSTGPNAELGGSNNTECHLDLPLRGCDLYLDEVPIVRQGELVHPELRVR